MKPVKSQSFYSFLSCYLGNRGHNSSKQQKENKINLVRAKSIQSQSALLLSKDDTFSDSDDTSPNGLSKGKKGKKEKSLGVLCK